MPVSYAPVQSLPGDPRYCMRVGVGVRVFVRACVRACVCAWVTVRMSVWTHRRFSSTPTSAPGLGSPLPHLRRDWAHPLPHVRRDLLLAGPHLRRDLLAHICAGTG